MWLFSFKLIEFHDDDDDDEDHNSESNMRPTLFLLYEGSNMNN